MAQLSATVNTRQPALFLATLSKIQRMMRTVWQSLLGMVSKPVTHLCTEENVRTDNDNVVKGSGEGEESNGKDAEVPMKVIPCLGHHHLSLRD